MDLTLCLTHDCNLACRYCYAGEKRPVSMSPEVAGRAIRFALSFRARRSVLSFFGGEPLLEWDLLVRATETAERLARRRGVLLGKKLTTNGTLLTRERTAWLKSHGFRPDVSIDGNREMHDAGRPFRDGRSSFEACMRGLDALLEHFPGAGVVVVPDPSNVRFLAEGVRFLVEERGVRRIHLNPNFYTDWPAPSRALWRRAYDEIADMYLRWLRAGTPVSISALNSKITARLEGGIDRCALCGFAVREIAVASSGRIYACERMVGDDTGETAIGDVWSGFDEGKRRALLSGSCEKPECADCSEEYRCTSFCKATNFGCTGSVATPGEALCFHERMSAEAADRAGSALLDEGNADFVRLFGGFRERRLASCG